MPTRTEDSRTVAMMKALSLLLFGMGNENV